MKVTLATIAMIITAFACRNVEIIDTSELNGGYDKTLTPDWTEKSHSNSAAPDYSIVFPQAELVEITLDIDANNWQIMQDNLNDLSNSVGGQPGQFASENPVWVNCSVEFNGSEWYHVGVRYKGNSSLYSVNGNKYSFKLDFDEFEEEYPEITNQRFFGFKQLNLKNNIKDASLMHEKIASDLFREFGIASAQTAFCKVYVNTGNGKQYFGLYTLTEEVDDTMLDSQFGTDSGNLYKPDNTTAQFAQGSYNETDFMKKNNEELNDYSDVEALYTIINSSLRSSDIEAWKSNLESVFDVDHFLRWLAANTAMQNWDTYGNMGHNYYLYNDPVSHKLTWIPWDNNEALSSGNSQNDKPTNKQAPGPNGVGGHSPLSISLSEVTNQWPLINYLINVDEYKAEYNAYLKEFVNGVFEPSKMIDTYSNTYNLIKSAVYDEESGYTFLTTKLEFEEGVEELKAQVQNRYMVVEEYLGK